MSHTDSISDMLTRIRNAVRATHETVEIPASKLKTNIAEVLKKEGYINSYEVVESSPLRKNIKINLKYGPRGEKLISGIKKVSSPGLRVYVKAQESPRVYGGLGISIISTSKGLMTDRQARKEGCGGELLCQVW
ncbi:MAG: 30S ribosomal protein S8 [Candidatus Melainabacteria bacterium RIFCSPHIGHO2_02_FULL_34_12]|nr:MAG: 30S ribosomal protein S8 [Candidatus Melainabacteria bacterium RIFCSPHIGHO2_02_FULL_34_12]